MWRGCQLHGGRFELFGEAAQLFAGCVELSGGLLSYLYLFGVIYIHLFCIKTGATGEVEWLRGRPTGSLVVEYHCSQPTRQDNACRFICFLFLKVLWKSLQVMILV